MDENENNQPEEDTGKAKEPSPGDGEEAKSNPDQPDERQPSSEGSSSGGTASGKPDETSIEQALESALTGDPESSEMSGEEDSTDFFGAPASDLWHQFTEIDQASQPGEEMTVREWIEDATDARAIVVSGHELSRTRAAAEELAVQLTSAYQIRGTRSHEINALDFAELIEILTPVRDKRCLIVNYWSKLATMELSRGLPDLSAAVKQHRDQNFYLILWTRSTGLKEMPQAGSWPSNIKLYPLPESTPQDPRLEEQYSPIFFANLFGHGIESLQEVLAAGSRLIEQMLVRICVLFGELPESDVEELLSGILKDVTIPVDSKQADESPSDVDALRLWRSGKAYFLRKAGLTRVDEGSTTRIGFPSDDIREAAAEAAWEDSHAMMEIFSAIRESAILFSDESTSNRRDLFEGYVNAVVVMARKLPQIYGAKWLDSISLEYLDWIRSETAENSPVGQGSGMVGLLSALESIVNERKRRRLEKRFSQRMGYLCRYLCSNSLKMVENFLSNLENKGLHPFTWALVLELRNTELDSVKWTRRVLDNSPLSFLHTALRPLAREAIAGPARFAEHSRLLSQWLPKDREPPEYRIGQAALLFPVEVLRSWFQLLGGRQDRSAAFTLNHALDTQLEPADGGPSTVRDYWITCLASPAIIDLFPSNSPLAPHQELALTVFRLLAVAETPEESSAAVDLARGIRRQNSQQWNLLRDNWRYLMGYFGDRARSSANDTTAENNKHYSECCRRLIQL